MVPIPTSPGTPGVRYAVDRHCSSPCRIVCGDEGRNRITAIVACLWCVAWDCRTRAFFEGNAAMNCAED